MCGIAGLIEPTLAGNGAALKARAQAMADAIAHRGPDGWGTWVDSEAGLALAHRRLAVVDVTPTGAQPMMSADGRWVISYNGEIYNAADLAGMPQLAGVRFRGTSDTEVMLESIARRGFDQALAEFNGMFAFALWDRKLRTLHLVRDRLGIKPLFYVVEGGRLRFGSELKALFADGFSGVVDRASVASFFRFGYVPAPHTIFAGVHKLMPGEVVTFSAGERLTRRFYWSLADVAKEGIAAPFDFSDAEAVDQLDDLLGDSVARQMISDVPLGAFLSGGIDSSAVVAQMVAAGNGPVRTFSIGFPDFGYDESKHAAAVARHLGTQHDEMIVSATDALAVVPRLPDIYDEPFADSSQIPTCLVSALTRQHVTAALSGDGGDELFAGYNRYAFAERINGTVLRLPKSARRAMAAVLGAIPDNAVEGLNRILPTRLRVAHSADKLRKIIEVLPYDFREFYLRLVSQCSEPETLANGISEHIRQWECYENISERAGLLGWMQILDTATYLPDDILQKVDRASMAVSLEVRPPFLDHRVVEFAFKLPRRFRIRHGETKWLLRRVLERYVPRLLFERPKMGFGVPLADWLRGPLRDWADDLLDPSQLGDGYVNVGAVRTMWKEHLGGEYNRAYSLWTVLMFEAWRRRWSVSCRSGKTINYGGVRQAVSMQSGMLE
jgi:asparagine synthase (glutamine-hydrolysing)